MWYMKLLIDIVLSVTSHLHLVKRSVLTTDNLLEFQLKVYGQRRVMQQSKS